MVAVRDETAKERFEREKRILKYRRPFVDQEEYPEARELLAAIPEDCFVRNTWLSCVYMTFSFVLVVGCGIAAWKFLPNPGTWSAVAVFLWVLYAAVQGTVATGLWVIAHECGHDAFSDNKTLQTVVGFVIHSFMLVPYFSWQRSHALHHAKTNHLTLGETHVPNLTGSPAGSVYLAVYNEYGEDAWAILNCFNHFVIGWPAYLLMGASGSPERGTASHFYPNNDQLFPGKWKQKVFISDVGVLAAILGLVWWGQVAGSPMVLALYVGPYFVVNFWLVLYTWLQHTDMDVPHYDSENWTWVKGAFCTVDRPYPAIVDFLHHRIGSTHVAHHICSRIPHYNARKATEAIREAFPTYYRYDPTPIYFAAERVARKCVVGKQEGTRWWYSVSA